jgi:predicted O-methyltransferase YrrM
MSSLVLNVAKAILPHQARAPLRSGWMMLQATLSAPGNRMTYLRARKERSAASLAMAAAEGGVRRMFGYDPALIPNSYVAELESRSPDIDTAIANTGLTIGYPAWNLLYYSLLCSLSAARREVIVVETGTNQGFSTILMAQALKDSGARGILRTVDIDPERVALARQNVVRAGLADRIEFHVEDSLKYLSRLVKEVPQIDFAFLDGSHEWSHVTKEFGIIYPRVVACRGKVYFDNTQQGGVAVAMRFIRRAYGGNFVEFNNCSWSPPGNAIWQAD